MIEAARLLQHLRMDLEPLFEVPGNLLAVFQPIAAGRGGNGSIAPVTLLRMPNRFFT